MRVSLFGLVLLAGLANIACDLENVEGGPDQTQPVSFNPPGIDAATVELHLGAGELNIRGGGSQLAGGQLDYNISSWKPIIHQTTAGHFARLRIEQPDTHQMPHNLKYTWNLQLSNTIPISLLVKCGAGQANLKVGDVRLRDLAVEIGAGQIDLDLRGTPKEDYDVNVQGGVGQATVYLPAGVGVRAEAHGAIGSIDVSGLHKHGSYYENDEYGRSNVNLRLKVKGGIGEIRIIGS
jgi:N-terminal domain of toast_rack, DUF2154